MPDDGKWHCLVDIKNGEKNLVNIFDLSENDIFISTERGNGAVKLNSRKFDLNGKLNSVDGKSDPFDANLCSAIRIVNGRAEIFLVAKPDGKFDTNSEVTPYVLSTSSNAYDTLGD